MYAPTVVDLFCGCGGLSWGLHQADFKILAGVDSWQPALNTFQHNHPQARVVHQDIRRLSPNHLLDALSLRQGELDCLIGGPPCQGFSKNVPASYRFLEDPRNQLFRDFLHFVEKLQPRVVLMENVAEIYNAYQGYIREEIIGFLTKLGYEVSVAILYAPDYGVPQRRRRCFFFAARTGIKPQFPRPSHGSEDAKNMFELLSPYPSAWSAISDLAPLEHGQGYEPMPYEREPCNAYQKLMRSDSSEVFDHVARPLRQTQYARLASIGPGQSLPDLPTHLRPKSGYSGAYGRLDFEMLAPTITRWVFHPGSGRFGHPRDIRLITIREAARLQSFSDDFRFLGTYIEKAHQVGNAVPPLMAKAFALPIKACLGISEPVR